MRDFLVTGVGHAFEGDVPLWCRSTVHSSLVFLIYLPCREGEEVFKETC